MKTIPAGTIVTLKLNWSTGTGECKAVTVHPFNPDEPFHVYMKILPDTWREYASPKSYIDETPEEIEARAERFADPNYQPFSEPIEGVYGGESARSLDAEVLAEAIKRINDAPPVSFTASQEFLDMLWPDRDDDPDFDSPRYSPSPQPGETGRVDKPMVDRGTSGRPTVSGRDGGTTGLLTEAPDTSTRALKSALEDQRSDLHLRFTSNPTGSEPQPRRGAMARVGQFVRWLGRRPDAQDYAMRIHGQRLGEEPSE